MARRVFISYARKDGTELAKRLQGDLSSSGYDVWVDTQRIAGGASWTKEIENALDHSEVILALLSPGSFISEICRAEQLRSLRKGKCVIPILLQRGVDIPLYLETKNYRDFSTPEGYSRSWPALVSDIQANDGVGLKPAYRQTYVTAPPIPPNFVERTEAVGALRATLITDGGSRNIALTAFAGMGGVGKTVLAQALCHDEIVQHAFPDGIIWMSAGKEQGFDLVTRFRELGKALNDDLSRYDNELGCKNQYRSTIRNKAALIVVDDVWYSRDLEPFLAESLQSRLLFTTRNSSIASAVGADEHRAELLTEQQSRAVLMQWANVTAKDAPACVTEIIRECGRLPLALSMVGAMLRGKPLGMWERVLGALRNADLEKIKAQFPYYPHPTLFRAIQISVDALDPTPRERYVALGVLPEEMPIHPVIQQTLWNCDEADALETSEQFLSLSLTQPDREHGSIRLHDLQLDYVRAQYPQPELLRLVRGAAKLSSHVITRDPTQFVSQISARLVAHSSQQDVSNFLTGLMSSVPKPWLLALWPTLGGPDSGLVRTLEGHSNGLNALAITPDGARVLSASKDKSIKIWDVETGQELQTLKGHYQAVNHVILTPDAKHLISASDDNTIKIWHLETAKLIRTLTGHWKAVNAIAISPDQRYVVSASDDNTLKIWDLETGRPLKTLVGHSKPVLAVGITPNGQLLISASEDHTLRIWHFPTGLKMLSLKGHTAAVNDVVISHDGRFAVSASSDDTIRVWDLSSKSEIRRFRAKSKYVWGVSLDSSSSKIASASEDNTIRIWSLNDSEDVRVLKGHSRSVHDVQFSPKGTVISASNDDTLKIWDLQSGIGSLADEGHPSAVYSISVSSNGQRAITASRDGEPDAVKVWTLPNREELFSVSELSSPVYDVAITEDGQLGIFACWDKTLQIWNLERKRKLNLLSGHNQCVSCVALSGDGQRGVSGSWDKTLKVWDLKTGREIRTLKGHKHCVNTVAIDAEAKWAVSGSEDKTLKLWEIDTGHVLQTMEGHVGPIQKVVVTRGFEFAVSASKDRRIRIWNLKTGRCIHTIEGHLSPVAGVAVSSDGKWIASASWDHTLRIWDFQSGTNRATYTMDSAAYSCVFSGARQIIAGDGAGQLHLVRLEE
jgi:WD40 repeat protein